MKERFNLFPEEFQPVEGLDVYPICKKHKSEIMILERGRTVRYYCAKGNEEIRYKSQVMYATVKPHLPS